MKLVFVHADPSDKIQARLTKLFTKSTAYHCGFLDEESSTFYDMNLLPRKTHWPRYHAPRWVTLYDVPKLTQADCERFMKLDGETKYGWMDYILFALRPLYHLVGKSTRNANGMICSEMCAIWLNRVGYEVSIDPVPSPGDLERWANKNSGKENSLDD